MRLKDAGSGEDAEEYVLSGEPACVTVRDVDLSDRQFVCFFLAGVLHGKIKWGLGLTIVSVLSTGTSVASLMR